MGAGAGACSGTGSSEAADPNLPHASESPGRWLHHRLLDPTSRNSNSVGLEQSQGKRLPSDAEVAGLGTTLWEPSVQSKRVQTEKGPGGSCSNNRQGKAKQ